MIVDYLRSCYETDCQFGPNDSTKGKIRWVWAEPNAQLFPLFTPFTSLNWLDKNYNPPAPPLGEILGAPRPWRDGSGFALSGDHYCGDIDWWKNGLPLPLPPSPPLVDGVPVCCTGASAATFTMTGHGEFNPVYVQPRFRIVQIQRTGQANTDFLSESWDYAEPGGVAIINIAVVYNVTNPVPVLTPPSGYELIQARSRPGLVVWDWVRYYSPAVAPRRWDFDQTCISAFMIAWEVVGLQNFVLGNGTNDEATGFRHTCGDINVTQKGSFVIVHGMVPGEGIFHWQGIGGGPENIARNYWPFLESQSAVASWYDLPGLFKPFWLDDIQMPAVASWLLFKIAGYDTPNFFRMAGQSSAQLIAGATAAGELAATGAGATGFVSGALADAIWAAIGAGSAGLVGSGPVSAAPFSMSGAGSASFVAPTGPSIVRGTTGTSFGSPTTQNMTWQTTTTTGSLLVVTVSVAGPLMMGSLTITAPAGYVLARDYQSAAPTPRLKVAIYYKKNAAAESSTGNWSVSGAGAAGMVINGVEYTGCDPTSPLDLAPTGQENTSASPSTPASGTTGTATEVCIGAMCCVNDVFTSITGGFSVVNQNNVGGSNGPAGCCLERIVTATGSYQAGATIGSSKKWAAVIATFK